MLHDSGDRKTEKLLHLQRLTGQWKCKKEERILEAECEVDAQLQLSQISRLGATDDEQPEADEDEEVQTELSSQAPPLEISSANELSEILGHFRKATRMVELQQWRIDHDPVST